MPAPSLSTAGYKTNTNCEVATPGAIITNMLGFQAGSNQRMGEYQAALTNGLDQVFSALASEFLKMALTRLTQGILGGDSNGNNAAYNSALDVQFQKAQQDYNNQINAATVSTSTVGDVNVGLLTNTYDQFAGQGYSNGFIATTTAYTPPDDTSMNYTDDPLYTQRQNALTRINLLENSELQFQNTMTKSANLLTKGRVVFVSARSCNIQYNNPVSTLRANLINSNVITNIDGVQDSSRNLANIPWNLTSIPLATSTSNSHLDMLDATKNNVSSATSSQGIIDALTPLSGTIFNTDPQASTTDNISVWLRGVRDMYKTSQCPIDLTSVFSTSTATTTVQ